MTAPETALPSFEEFMSYVRKNIEFETKVEGDQREIRYRIVSIQEDDFVSLDLILEKFYPHITLLKYKRLCRESMWLVYDKGKIYMKYVWLDKLFGWLQSQSCI